MPRIILQVKGWSQCIGPSAHSPQTSEIVFRENIAKDIKDPGIEYFYLIECIQSKIFIEIKFHHHTILPIFEKTTIFGTSCELPHNKLTSVRNP